jgi:hypothetical protein
MMPLAAMGRYPFLGTRGHEHPDIETMSGADLESEIEVCRFFEGHHRAEVQAIGKLDPSAHATAAYDWFTRRLRVQELLARGAGRAAS